MLTGRGCGWGRCTFCSDVTSANGRTFRSRSWTDVLAEMELQAHRHDTQLFVFNDLKLNSNLRVWRGLIEDLRQRLPDAKWTAAVHVGAERPNGLSAEELVAARQAGLIRITTGLESGSQELLKRMVKGTRLGRTSQFLRDAKTAGISVRVTTIIGYPGETPRDLAQTAEFLDEHRHVIDRVQVCRFSVQPGTPIHQHLVREETTNLAQRDLVLDHKNAILSYDAVHENSRAYRRAVARVLGAIHRINREPLIGAAYEFQGVM